MAKRATKQKSTRTQGIPDDVKKRVHEIVEAFNEREIKAKNCRYVARFRGRYLFLDRCERGTPSPICRLEYTGDLDDWGFAIYKYSRDTYDAHDWFFPGSQHIDGTIEGAMRTGIEAYPCSTARSIRSMLGCLVFFVLLPWRLLVGFVRSKFRRGISPTIADTRSGEETDNSL
ncbi:MAG: hypothetical protein JXB07_22265 [Anaerolineae bacterium]|nr:hypothetical protein [Anaerolineae bacterium]